jgi:hypothetical protein
MTHVSCPDCRLRFTPAAASYLPACPNCGEPLTRLGGPAEVIGFRLYELDDALQSLPEALEVAMPAPDPHAGRS